MEKTHLYSMSPAGLTVYGLPLASAARMFTTLAWPIAATPTPPPYTLVFDATGSPGFTVASHGEPVTLFTSGSPVFVTNVIASDPACVDVKFT